MVGGDITYNPRGHRRLREATHSDIEKPLTAHMTDGPWFAAPQIQLNYYTSVDCTAVHIKITATHYYGVDLPQ